MRSSPAMARVSSTSIRSLVMYQATRFGGSTRRSPRVCPSCPGGGKVGRVPPCSVQRAPGARPRRSGCDASDAGPPVREVVWLGEKLPDIVARREQLAGYGIGRHGGRSVAVPTRARAPRARTSAVGSTRGGGRATGAGTWMKRPCLQGQPRPRRSRIRWLRSPMKRRSPARRRSPRRRRRAPQRRRRPTAKARPAD